MYYDYTLKQWRFYFFDKVIQLDDFFLCFFFFLDEFELLS